ncbi:MAG TPA: 6-carboxytetrahydropterin synthase [Longimicrobiales bacterium]|nr:6-carboxytetrahydropterin synthase [Longimicrobiales bacterium]
MSRPIVRATKRLHFSAAHRLHRPEWSDERNLEVFGPCANPNWHGHNYEVDVTVEGPVDPETGFVVDLKRLKELVERHVIDDVDHRNLNTEVPWLDGIIPSTENVAVAIWNRLADRLPEGVRLVSVLLRETPRNWVEYTGPQEEGNP